MGGGGDHHHLIRSSDLVLEVHRQGAENCSAVDDLSEEGAVEAELIDDRPRPVSGFRVVELGGRSVGALILHHSGQPVGKQIRQGQIVLRRGEHLPPVPLVRHELIDRVERLEGDPGLLEDPLLSSQKRAHFLDQAVGSPIAIVVAKRNEAPVPVNQGVIHAPRVDSNRNDLIRIAVKRLLQTGLDLRKQSLNVPVELTENLIVVRREAVNHFELFQIPNENPPVACPQINRDALLHL
ncbi:MAG: hypothetical protein BWY50_02035 [Spirochaetes bacterium ADurb.Bin315]|nr:MAG: hypothetical protein BWY50_02035 [Spirochaetes bacterium ADurb.Bin315]